MPSAQINSSAYLFTSQLWALHSFSYSTKCGFVSFYLSQGVRSIRRMLSRLLHGFICTLLYSHTNPFHQLVLGLIDCYSPHSLTQIRAAGDEHIIANT